MSEVESAKQQERWSRSRLVWAKDALEEIRSVTPDAEDLSHGDGGYEAGQIARKALEWIAAGGVEATREHPKGSAKNPITDEDLPITLPAGEHWFAVEVEATEDSPRSELCDFIPTPEMHGEVVCQRCGSEEHGGDVDYSGCADCREPAERLEGSSS